MRRIVASVILIVVGVAVMVLRQPAYLLEPGFFGEEGNVYFFRAWHRPWWRVLPDAPSGYLLLFTNVSALAAARLVPLSRAPLVTTLLALAVQTAPIALIAFGAAPEWKSLGRRALAIGVLLFGSLSSEIWLNTINSQCYFVVLAILLLLEPADLTRARTFVYGGLLGLAGASSPVAAALTPLFALKAVLLRRRSAWALCGVAILGLALQGAAVLATHGGDYVARRGSGVGLASVAGLLWMRSVILPILGPAPAESFARSLLAWTRDDLGSSRALAAGVTLLVGLVAMVLWLAHGLDPRRRIALAGGYAIVAPLVTLLASGPQHSFLSSAEYSPRYFYAPGVILLLLLLANVDSQGGERRIRSVLCSVLLAVALGLGAVRYRESASWRPTWPRWPEQVAAWEQNPGRSLLTWPPGWQILYLVAPTR